MPVWGNEHGKHLFWKADPKFTYWIPGVNNNGQYGRWAFAEFTEVYQIESDFKAKVEKEFDNMIGKFTMAKG